MGDQFYETHQYTGLGVWGGAVLGLLFAIAFVPVAVRLADKYAVQQMTLFLIAAGMITGILCSTVLHCILMIAHVQATPMGIIIGLPFGIMCGAILGYMTGINLNIRESDSADDQN